MTTYYVDNSSKFASDTNAGTSAGSPLLSLAAVNKLVLRPGDVVAFKAGTSYTASAAGDGVLKIGASGTDQAHITFTSYGEGAKPIINNASTADYSDAMLVKGSYIDINGLQFTQATRAGVHTETGASHITVQNSEMTNVGIGVMVEGTSSLVTKNYIHDLHMVKNTPTSVNNDDDYGANGVLISGSNNEVSYNKIVNAKAPSYDYVTDGGGIELFGNITNLSIHHNWVEGSEGFLEAGGFKGSMANISISNNVSLNNSNFVVIHNGGGQFANTFSNVVADHNTIVEQYNTPKKMAVVFLDAPATAGSFSFTNNVVSLNNGDSVFKQEGNYHSNNVFNLQSSATHLYNNWSMTLGTNESYGDPAFRNLSTFDLTPTSARASTYGATLSLADFPTMTGGSRSSVNVAPVVSVTAQEVMHGTSLTSDKLFNATDANGDAITKYEVSISNPTSESGYWVLNGVNQTASSTIGVSAADLANLRFSAGWTADQVQIRAYDGQVWSGWSATTVKGTNVAPIVASEGDKVVARNTVLSGSSLFRASDADGDSVVKYQVADLSATATTGALSLRGVAQAAGTTLDLSPTDLANLTFKAGIGTDTIQIRAYDGHAWSSWTNVNITGTNTAPIVTAPNATVTHGSTTALSALFTARDAEGDTVQKYQVVDLSSATNSGNLILNGVTQQAGAVVEVTAAQLAQLSVSAGSGVNALQVRAYDGTEWGAWAKFNITAPVNAAPVISASNATVGKGTVLDAGSLFTATDADRDVIAKYQFIDYGTAAGSGTFTLNGVVQSAGTTIELSPAQLSQLRFVSAVGNDTISVRAFDGLDWGNWTNFIVKGTNSAPTISAAATTIGHGAQVAVSSLFNAADANGDQITRYQFTDLTGSTESGNFVLNGAVQAYNQTIELASTDLQNLSFRAGSGVDQVRVRAFDGTDWGVWTTMNVTAPIDSAAVVSASGASIARNATVGMRTLFTVSDAENDAVSRYQVVDYTSAATSGKITAKGAVLAANQVVDLTAAELSQATFTAGTTSDSIAVRAFDGVRWGTWTTIAVNPAATMTAAATTAGSQVAIADSAPTVTTQDQTLIHNVPLAAQSLVQATDVDGDAVTTTQFRVVNSTARSGHFYVNGIAYASDQTVEVSASQLAQTTFRAGGGTETLEVRASDGMAWSNWQTVHVSAPAAALPSVTGVDTTLAHNGSTAIAQLFQAETSPANPISRYQVIDTTAETNSGHLEFRGQTVAANVVMDLSATDLASLVFKAGSGSDTLQIRAFDGAIWSEWGQAQVTAPINNIPQLDTTAVSLAHGAKISAASLFKVQDADHDAVKFYQFADLSSAANSGHFVVDGDVLKAGQYVTLTPAEMANVRYEGGSGTDIISVRVSDGTDWSAWERLNVQSPINAKAVVSGTTSTLTHDSVVQASSLFTATDADHDTITRYQIIDNSDRATSGHLILDGDAVAAKIQHDLSAADMARLQFQAGSTTSDYLQVRAFDGIEWGNWTALSVWPTNDAAVVTTTGVTAARQGTVAASTLFNVSDPNHDTITRYQLVDWTSKAGSGFLSVAGVVQQAEHTIDLTAAQFANTTFTGSSFASGDDIALRVFDGLQWSNWTMAHV